AKPVVVSRELIPKGNGVGNVKVATLPAHVAAVAVPNDVGVLETKLVVVSSAVLVETLLALKVVAVTLMVMTAVLPTARLVEAVGVLLEETGSLTVLETVAVAEMIVPAATPEFTLTTSGKLTLVPTARVPVRLQVTVPVAPTAGVVQDQPEGTGASE